MCATHSTLFVFYAIEQIFYILDNLWRWKGEVPNDNGAPDICLVYLTASIIRFLNLLNVYMFTINRKQDEVEKTNTFDLASFWTGLD